MSILSGFRKKLFPSYLGVDLGTTAIKAVEVRPGKQLPTLMNYGLLEATGHLIRPNVIIQSSSFKISEMETAELLALLMRSMRPTTTQAIAALPPFIVFTTVLTFPKMGKEELNKAVVFQARQYVPQPLSEVQLDWIKVGEFHDDKGFEHEQILLIAVPQEYISKYQNIFKRAGLTLTALEIESLSITRALLEGDATPTIIIDVGSRSTNIVFADKGMLHMNAQTDYASTAITQALASSLHINPNRAEELKRERGIAGAGPNYELSTVMLPFIDIMLGEVKKAQFQYTNQFPAGAKMERVLLTGGGSALQGLRPYVEEQLGLPTALASPFFRFEYPSAIEPLVKELGPLLGVALGLTLREFTEY